MIPLLTTWPEWAGYLLRGILLFLMLMLSAIVIARAGRNPYWALVTILPWGFVIGAWGLAYAAWKRKQRITIL